MDCSMSGFPVHHHLPELAQTHVHWVGDAIQSSHPLSSPSPPAFNLSQHQGLFTWVSFLHQVANILELQLQHQSFQWKSKTDFLYDWLVWSPCCPRDSQESSPTITVQKHQFFGAQPFLIVHQFFGAQPFLIVQLSHLYMTTRTAIALTMWTFVGKVMSLLFHTRFRFLIAFLPRSKCLLISWLQSPSALIWEPKKIKSVTVSIVSPSICHEVMGPDAMILVFWMLSFKPAFSLSSFTFIKKLFSSSSLSAIRVVSSVYLRLLIFLPLILIPACASSSPAFLMMYSAYKLNKQGDNIQAWCTPLPILNQSIVPCPVLTIASWPAYRFHRRQVR